MSLIKLVPASAEELARRVSAKPKKPAAKKPAAKKPAAKKDD
jgi:hypothetical protein